MNTACFRIEDHPEADAAILVPAADRLEPGHVLEFRVACLKLLDTGRQRLFLNLNGVKAISRDIAAAIVDACALAQGRELVVVASEAVAEDFKKLAPRLYVSGKPPGGAAGDADKARKGD